MDIKKELYFLMKTKEKTTYFSNEEKIYYHYVGLFSRKKI